jgi:hypothetical protein
VPETWKFEDPSVARSPAIAAALRYWRSKGGETAIPSRAAIDPLEMRAFLSKILIVEAKGERKYVYRLCGTEITNANGQDLTGRQADEAILGASAGHFIDSYERTIRTRAPVFFVGQLWWQNREYVAFEQVNLPLSSDGNAVDQLLCIVDFEVLRRP